MGYVFPLVRRIDEGTERWVRPSRLPEVDGATWSTQVRYMTFIPDFVPASLMPLAARLESWLERSSLRQWSAHYIACLTKEAG